MFTAITKSRLPILTKSRPKACGFSAHTASLLSAYRPEVPSSRATTPAGTGQRSCRIRCLQTRELSRISSEIEATRRRRSARCTLSTNHAGTVSLIALNAATHLARLTASESRSFSRGSGFWRRDDRKAIGPCRSVCSGTRSTQRRQFGFLRAHREKAFCLWASFFMPHTPLVPHRKYWDVYDGIRLDLPERSPNALEGGFHGHLVRAKERGWYQQTDEQLHDAIRGYYGNVSQMDANVGRVFDTLRELGLDENTVVVYTSDHGEMAGAHRMWTKHNMYEQSVRVPLIVRTPARSDAGSSRDHIVEQVDLFPTLAELCGFGAPAGIDGRSFAAPCGGSATTHGNSPTPSTTSAVACSLRTIDS